MAGWGQVDGATIAALGSFAEAIEADPRNLPNLWFDLSAAMTPASFPTDRAELATLAHRIGPYRVLAGLDWPSTTDLVDLYDATYPHLPLKAGQAAIVRGNVASYGENGR